VEKAGDILKQFLDKQSLKAANNYSSFFRSWETIAGEDTAAHSRILDVRKKTLIIEVDHPAWMQMLQMRYKEILNNVQKTFPELSIDKMHIRVGESEPSRKHYSPDPAPSVEEPTHPEEQPEEQSGEEHLKEALERLKKSIDEKAKRAKS
jgi:hypothetical protein